MLLANTETPAAGSPLWEDWLLTPCDVGSVRAKLGERVFVDRLDDPVPTCIWYVMQ